jgi:hypothetical protein
VSAPGSWNTGLDSVDGPLRIFVIRLLIVVDSSTGPFVLITTVAGS